MLSEKDRQKITMCRTFISTVNLQNKIRKTGKDFIRKSDF